MGTISYTYRMLPGATISAAQLDANFAEVATEVASLGKDNFRHRAGFANVNKASPYSVSVLCVNFRSITFTDTSGTLYIDAFSYPHNETVGSSTYVAPTVDAGRLVNPFKIKRAQLVYDSITGSSTSDSISLVTSYVKSSTRTPGFGSVGAAAGGALSGFAANSLSTSDYSVTDAIAVCSQVKIVPDSGTVGTRTITNLTAILTLEVPHIA